MLDAADLAAMASGSPLSPEGERLYARLGYETQYHYREYVRWEAPA